MGNPNLPELIRDAQNRIPESKPSACADCSDLKPFDEQVRLLYNEAGNPPVANMRYRLIDKNTQIILEAGKTDNNGLTQRASTDKPVELEIAIARLNQNRVEEYKVIDVCRTNDVPNSRKEVLIYRGRLFFDIRYLNPVLTPNNRLSRQRRHKNEKQETEVSTKIKAIYGGHLLSPRNATSKISGKNSIIYRERRIWRLKKGIYSRTHQKRMPRTSVARWAYCLLV